MVIAAHNCGSTYMGTEETRQTQFRLVLNNQCGSNKSTMPLLLRRKGHLTARGSCLKKGWFDISSEASIRMLDDLEKMLNSGQIIVR
jgi:hypothetical protein